MVLCYHIAGGFGEDVGLNRRFVERVPRFSVFLDEAQVLDGVGEFVDCDVQKSVNVPSYLALNPCGLPGRDDAATTDSTTSTTQRSGLSRTRWAME